MRASCLTYRRSTIHHLGLSCVEAGSWYLCDRSHAVWSGYASRATSVTATTPGILQEE
eukprot:CAMPEP_0202877900 /NCGR_PEP_ID=MMETSP1391-20130828/31316_1 /ASSEMBLY_ACC=CAM_ASM_000867 /TAXON_ID=1034604 /ORGANISM="Chlamydomonas leiostraca, Strain SAG 11-49" /LENGTH=57 /DNA_ID=CAMNT_0049560003 /DNA_START=35 /DNA_END=208 /DNA_ORIENTATION=+